jgi:AraC-like DNA-binding protein
MSALVPLPFHAQAFSTPLGAWEFLIAPPPPDLVGVVESFWISRGQVSFILEKVLPQNNVELMFNLERPFGVPNRPPAHRRYRRAWVAGMQRDYLVVTPDYDVRDPSYLLSVRMPPLGAYRVLGLPMGAIAHDVLELDDVLGDQVHAVHERLGALPSPGLQFALLCDFVRRRLGASRIRLRADAQAAVQRLADSAGQDQIEAICRSLCVSRKHLNALFLAHIGLTPKTYARMFRFRRIIDLLQTGARPDWTRLALSAGYYDQSHFNREFREFAGMTPSEYARAGSTDGLTLLVTRD